MTQHEGTFTIPTRIFLTDAQRAKLQHLVQRDGVDLPELLTELLTHHLDALPDAPPDAPEPAEPVDRPAVAAKRAELARLRARKQAGGGASAWLDGYIADLEADLERLKEKG